MDYFIFGVVLFFYFFKPKHTRTQNRLFRPLSLKLFPPPASSSFSSSSSLIHHRKGDDDASCVTNEHEAEVSDMAREICSRVVPPNGLKNATTYLRTFRVSDAESENCARGFFFRFSWKRFSVQIRTGRKPSVWRQTRQRLPRLESHARSSRVE